GHDRISAVSSCEVGTEREVPAGPSVPARDVRRADVHDRSPEGSERGTARIAIVVRAREVAVGALASRLATRTVQARAGDLHARIGGGHTDGRAGSQAHVRASLDGQLAVA